MAKAPKTRDSATTGREEAACGTAVTIVESGFDCIPLERRAEAFRMNDQGWGQQVENLARHVA